MKVVLMTFNAKFIHKALSLRWLYVSRDKKFDTEIVEYTINDELEHCLVDMLSRNPDVVVCSTYIWNVEMMKQWVTLLKKHKPELRIILGGPEVSFECEAWLNTDVECVLRGEGEVTLWQAIRKEENIDGYYSSKYISDVAYAKVDLAYLETLESPYFLEYDLHDMNKRYFYFETSRGCPFKCSYCLSSVDNEVRLFSKEYIYRQLLELENHSVKQVKLLDRTFNASDDVSYEFVKFLETIKCNCTFQFEIVVDRLSKRMLNFLCNEATVSKYRFEVGIQSFHLPTLKAVHRFQNLEKCKEVIRLLTDIGYQLHVDLIGGLPFEDIRLFENSFNQLFETKAKEIQVGILKLLKGTKLKSETSKYDLNYSSEPPYIVLSTQWLSNEDINTIHRVYHATEKIYNSNRCYNALQTFYDLKMIRSPFQVFNKCALKMNEIKQIQLLDLFKIVYEVVSEENDNLELIKCILLNDYYRLFKQRPQKCFKQDIEPDCRKMIFKNAIKQCQLSEQLVYNYTELTKGYVNNQIAYQLVLYSNKQVLPTRIWFDMNTYEVIYDERDMDSDNK